MFIYFIYPYGPLSEIKDNYYYYYYKELDTESDRDLDVESHKKLDTESDKE